MDYFISRNQENYGPYSEAEIREHLSSGALSPEDHAWRTGETEWKALGELMERPVAGAAELPFCPASAEKTAHSSGDKTAPSGTVVPDIDSRRRGLGGFLRVLAVTAFLAALVYLASPYVYLLLLNRALGSGDSVMIGRLVDFPSLREGLHAEASARKEAAGSPGQALPFLGVEPPMIPMAAAYIEQRFLTPSGLPSLLSHPDLALREQSSGTFASMTGQRMNLSRFRSAFFTGPTVFVARLEGLRLTIRLSGGFWRLERIEFS